MGIIKFSSPREEVLYTIRQKKKDQETTKFSRSMMNTLWILRDLLNQMMGSLDGIYYSITDSIQQVMGYAQADLYVLNEEETELRGFPDSSKTLFPGSLEKILQNNHTIPIEQGLAVPLIGNQDIRKDISYPSNPECIMGYLVINKPGELDESTNEHEFLLRYGRRAGPGIHNCLLRKKLKVTVENYKDLLNIVAHEFRGLVVSAQAAIAVGNFDDLENILKFLEGEVNKYLKLENFEKGGLKLEIKPVDIGKEIIPPVLERIQWILHKYKRNMDESLGGIPPEKYFAYCDAPYIETVFSNLFSNAVQHGSEDRPIAYGVKDIGDYLEFNVWNSGAIPEEERVGLFEKFQKGSRSKGTGFGLYMSKKIIGLHKGEMWVDFGDDYTDFKFTLPKAV